MTDLVLDIRLAPQGPDMVGKIRIPLDGLHAIAAPESKNSSVETSLACQLDHADEHTVRTLWPQALTDLVDVASHDLKGVGISVQDAARFARICIGAIARYHGGRQFYLPCGESLSKGLRDKQIWEEFDGKNLKSLASKYRLSEMSIRGILHKQRRLHRSSTLIPKCVAAALPISNGDGDG